MEKITIKKEDIAGIEVTSDYWVFTINESKDEVRKPTFSQEEIEDMHAKSGKFGGNNETLA